MQLSLQKNIGTADRIIRLSLVEVGASSRSVFAWDGHLSCRLCHYRELPQKSVAAFCREVPGTGFLQKPTEGTEDKPESL